MLDAEAHNSEIPTSIEAKAIAIESNSLVLQTVDTGELLHWPLNKIKQPFQIGKSLNLALINSDNAPLAESKPKATSASKVNEEDKRKLLEKMLN